MGRVLSSYFWRRLVAYAIANPLAKRWLKTLDHSAIYLLIAGNYPFLLVGLRTELAIGLMVVIWIIAILGVIMKVSFVVSIQSIFTIKLSCYGVGVFGGGLSIGNTPGYYGGRVVGGWWHYLLIRRYFLR